MFLYLSSSLKEYWMGSTSSASEQGDATSQVSRLQNNCTRNTKFAPDVLHIPPQVMLQKHQKLLRINSFGSQMPFMVV